MIQPNQFFGGINDPEETESETDSRAGSLDFGQSNGIGG